MINLGYRPQVERGKVKLFPVAEDIDGFGLVLKVPVGQQNDQCQRGGHALSQRVRHYRGKTLNCER